MMRLLGLAFKTIKLFVRQIPHKQAHLQSKWQSHQNLEDLETASFLPHDQNTLLRRTQ